MLNLTKGERLDLSKVAPNTKVYGFALGWDPQKFDGKPFDLDASVFFLKDGKVVDGVPDFLFYGATGFVKETGIQNFLGCASHSGDDQNGGKAGDDETIKIDTSKVNTTKYNEAQFNVTIYEADARKQTFGQVDNAFIRVFDAETGVDIAKFDLTEDACTNTAVVMSKLYFKDGTWRFQAIGSGFNGGLAALCNSVGIAANAG